MAGTERQLKPNTSPLHPAVEAKRQRLQDTLMTYDRTWTIEPVRPDQSMNQGDVLQQEMTAIKLGMISITKLGLKTEHGCHPNSVVTSDTSPTYL